MKPRVSVRDLGWGYAAQLLNLAAGVLLLPLLSRHVPPDVVGLWLVFITLVSLAQLIELGLQPTLARAVAYAHAGMTELRGNGLSAQPQPQATANPQTLLALQRAGKLIYRYAAVLTCLLLLLAGTGYIEWVMHKNPDADIPRVHTAWALFSAGSVLNTYFGYYAAFIQGRGNVTQGNQVIVVSKTVFVILGAALIIHGDGLLGLGIAAFVSALAGRLLAMRFYSRGEIPSNDQCPELKPFWRALLPNAARLAAVQLGTFLILRASILLGANYISLSEVASYGITVQVLVTLCGIASLIMNLQMPKMNACQAQGDKQTLQLLLGSTVVLSWLVYWTGAAILMAFGNLILDAVGKGTPLLQPLPLLALTLIFFLEMNHSVFAGYLTTLNQVPFMAAAIVSGISTVVLGLVLCSVAGLGVWGLILAQGLVQAAYNNWKWPREAMLDVGAGLGTLMRRGSLTFIKPHA